MKSIISLNKDEQAGLRKLRKDFGTSAKYVAKRHTSHKFERVKRPPDVPKTKSFDNHRYTYYGAFTAEQEAKHMSKTIRSFGNYARITKYKDLWIVWQGKTYKK